MTRTKLHAELLRDEGLRLKPYTDTVGKLTIGVGRNLTDVGISHGEALILLDHDIDKTVAAVRSRWPWFDSLDDVRQRVLCNMGFNLGVPGLAKFAVTLASIQRGDYAKAAEQMLQSKWASQVKGRADRLAEMMRTGAVA